MTKLLELTENFGVSRPVFLFRLGSDEKHFDVSSPIDEYKPEPIADDVLSELVCSCYHESFNIKELSFYIEKDKIAEKAMSRIRGSIEKFIRNNLEMKNPRQSKLYRWAYRSMPSNTEFNDVLVMVYKYLRSFSNHDMRSSNKEHTKNGIALLEAIMEKHGE